MRRQVVRLVEAKKVVTFRFWCTRILPVGLFMALTLHFGNLVYLYLTVAFIQMLKVSRRRAYMDCAICRIRFLQYLHHAPPQAELSAPSWLHSLHVCRPCGTGESHATSVSYNWCCIAGYQHVMLLAFGAYLLCWS